MSRSEKQNSGVEIKMKKEFPVLKTSGYTLIELMVVLAIVSVLVLVSIPLFDSYMEQTRVDELKATILKAAASQEKYFAATGKYSASAIDLQKYDYPDLPNTKMKLFTGVRIENGRGMIFWVNGSYDIGKAERECWVYIGSSGEMRRLTSSDPLPYNDVDCD